MNPCRQCARYHYHIGPSGWLETCGPDGRSIVFMRDPIGVYGEPHCGPEGKYWEKKT